jgi:hypothetical protein
MKIIKSKSLVFRRSAGGLDRAGFGNVEGHRRRITSEA